MIPAYLRDPWLVELDTRVVAAGEDDAGSFVVLADTLFYPEGGGQPADRGWIGGRAVSQVYRAEGKIRHTVPAPLPQGEVRLRLDWGRRFDHMQQHTGQHLLTALAHDRFGWPTTAFHLGEEVSDIELGVTSLGPASQDELEEAVAAEIRAARPVRSRLAAAETGAGLPGVRTRGLPDGFSGQVRLVEIEGLDLNTCGGTHLENTAQLEGLKLLGTEPMRGGTRLFFVAGVRLRKRLAGHEARNARLRDLLGAPDHQLPEAAEARLEQLRIAGREIRAAEENWAAAVLEVLRSRPGPVVAEHFAAATPAFLQRIGRGFALRAGEKLGFFTAGEGPEGFFLLAGGPDFPGDVQAAGRRVAAILEGRGGGAGSLAQGKVNALERRGEALAWLVRGG